MPTKQEKLLEEFRKKAASSVYEVVGDTKYIPLPWVDSWLSQAFQTLLESRDAQIVEMLEKMKYEVDDKIFPYSKFPSTHDEAAGYNQALDDAIKSLVHSK